MKSAEDLLAEIIKGKKVIRSVNINDAEAICDLYNYYVVNTTFCFEELPVSLKDMETRIRDISAVYPWLVFEEDDKIIAYAYVNKWKERSAYRYSVEDSIYVRHGYGGKGIGKKLLAALLDEVRKTKIHTIIAGITFPNESSIALHEKAGFRKVAHFSEVGFKFGRWIDIGYWELPPSDFEKRQI